MPAAWGVDGDGTTGPDAGAGPDAAVLPAVARLAEIPGVSARPGPGDHRGDGPGHVPVPDRRPPGVVGGLCPVGPSSPGPAPAPAGTARATPGSRGLGQAAIGAARTDTFLGERYWRIARRRGKAQGPGRRRPVHPGDHLAPARRPRRPVTDLGAGYYQARTDKDSKIRNHIRQIEALLGHPVTITPKAA